MANRVQKIHDLFLHDVWRKVSSEGNSADFLTREINLGEFKESELYSNGPVWLSQDKSEWPTSESCPSHQIQLPSEEVASTVLPCNVPTVTESCCLVIMYEIYQKFYEHVAEC